MKFSKADALEQKELALKLLQWHGGMNSPLYAVGSCMLSDADKGIHYQPECHRGHPIAILKAALELREMKTYAKFPENITEQSESELFDLACELEQYI